MGRPSLLMRAMVIAALGVGLGAAHSVLGPELGWFKPIVLRAAAPPTVISGDAPSAPGTVTPGATAAAQPAALGLEITIEQARQLYESGLGQTAFFVDTRTRAEYEAEHIEGAFHLSSDMMSGGSIPEVLNYMDRSAAIVLYCGGGACDASHNMAILLQQAGFARCHIIKDGIPGWKAAGLPVASGPGPLGGGQ